MEAKIIFVVQSCKIKKAKVESSNTKRKVNGKEKEKIYIVRYMMALTISLSFDLSADTALARVQLA